MTTIRPVQFGDKLSFDTNPRRKEDLMLVTAKWLSYLLINKSEQYWITKATNLTAGDTAPYVTLLIQKSFYEKDYAHVTGTAYLTIDKKCQYGQDDDQGNGRFVVYHKESNGVKQHQLVPNFITEVVNILHALASAKGQSKIADTVRKLEGLIDKPLVTFSKPKAQTGDRLLVPVHPKEHHATVPGIPTTIAWQRGAEHKVGEYHSLTVTNQTTGEDVLFFIQSDRYDYSNPSAPDHIARVAEKVEDGFYHIRIDPRFQFGEELVTSQNRFVVYHKISNRVTQDVFLKAALDQNSPTAGSAMSFIHPDREVLHAQISEQYSGTLATFE